MRLIQMMKWKLVTPYTASAQQTRTLSKYTDRVVLWHLAFGFWPMLQWREYTTLMMHYTVQWNCAYSRSQSISGDTVQALFFHMEVQTTKCRTSLCTIRKWWLVTWRRLMVQLKVTNGITSLHLVVWTLCTWGGRNNRRIEILLWHNSRFEVNIPLRRNVIIVFTDLSNSIFGLLCKGINLKFLITVFWFIELQMWPGVVNE